MTDLTRRLLAGTAALTLIGTALTGCSEDRLTAPCAVLIDGSGSGDKFDAAKRLDDTFNSFLLDNGCGSVGFVPIDSAPLASTCFIKTVDIDPDLGGNSDPETVRGGRRKLALKNAQEMLACAKKNPYSDVMGGLQRAVQQKPTGTGTYQLLVVSDMLQNTPQWSLYKTDLKTPAAIAKAVQERAANAPNLAGARVSITDCGVTLGSSEQAQQVRSFWTQLFGSTQAGNPEVSFER
ncbi:hypothetical protein Q0Z83_045540 [Actinoplanes sichuanensis]|uniref:VWA domain-containing protein n=1 Tax=Actinoplanes sichuanensis TaxID=512349 RepID=A0ABW4A9K3_9ACTN|nr:hypothetical protein [Actinoplanes sichuanensis]BEL06363.1 hypothetical protein Q0Z83_045540 [Actinoplanes sichuanensis]